jgi:catechol 2,3-dioxygenase-like lactoylglutathione lyase family enzyme
MIRKLHHAAYRCRDSEETRAFYEGFLGLPLVNAFEIVETKSGRETSVLHSFFALGDGSYLAFFEEPETPFEFKAQRDFDLHIALEVDAPDLSSTIEKARRNGFDIRAADHHFIDSVYLRDPNGYVVELTARRESHDAAMDPARNGSRANLARWQEQKASAAR